MNKIPQSWMKVKIRELCDVIKDKGSENRVPYLEIGDIDIVSKTYLLKDKPSVKGCRAARKNDLILSRVRPSRGAIVPIQENNLLISSAFTVLRNKGALADKYLWFFLAWNNDYLSYLGNNCTGTMYPTTSDMVVVNFEVPVAPRNEQFRIVSKLEGILHKVQISFKRLEKIPRLLNRFRQSILAAACSGSLTADWRENKRNLLPTGSNTGVYGELPESWTWKQIFELPTEEKGSIQSGPFGSNLLHSEFQSTGILAIGIDNVLDGEFSLGKQHRISLEKYKLLRKYTARPLDVLITVMATVGRCCVVPPDIETAIITKHIYRISCDLRLINPYFLMHCLRGCPAIETQIQSEIRGATRPGINGKILKEIYVPLPHLSEQEEIVRRVAQLFKLSDQIEARYQKAKSQVDKLTQSILYKAFRGQLVPQDPNDEPVSVLLEGIRMQRKMQDDVNQNQRGVTKMARKKNSKESLQRHFLVDVLIEARKSLKPEELFSQAGYDKDSIESFFTELRSEVKAGKIKEIRPNEKDVFLEVTQV